MKTNVVKLHKTTCEELIDSLPDNFIELYAVGVEIVDGERIIRWYSAGNKSRMQAAGVLDFLKLNILTSD